MTAGLLSASPQVGRLVTVASLGNSRCVLDTGAAGPATWLQLSRDHVIAADALERQRLAAAGCHLAARSLDGRGPAATPSSGDGLLRLWPGEGPRQRCRQRLRGRADAAQQGLPHGACRKPPTRRSWLECGKGLLLIF